MNGWRQFFLFATASETFVINDFFEKEYWHLQFLRVILGDVQHNAPGLFPLGAFPEWHFLNRRLYSSEKLENVSIMKSQTA